ncbi:MAG: quinoprotein dehydrogenase-associated SoxYZ-like carrier [Dichotomicrobium sp.]
MLTVRNSICWIGLCLLAAVLAASPAQAADEIGWKDLKPDLFGERPIEDGADLVKLEIPSRPQDAGLVPVGISMLRPQTEDWRIETITLVVDRNPVPLAVVFRLGAEAGISRIATRIRIDQYSDVRVIAETGDGRLYMVSQFVKATGGCSAPAVSGSGEDALAQLGRMRLRQHAIETGDAYPARTPSSRSLVLQIRHPNHSGFQKDPMQGYFIPAHFVDTISIKERGKPVLSVEGGISLSENPSIRFDFVPRGGSAIRVHAEDSDGNIFEKSWPLQSFLQHDSALRHD